MSTDARTRLGAILFLLLAPAVLLAPGLFWGKTLHPWDPAQFAPTFDTLDDAQRAQVTAEPRNFDVTEIPGLVVPEIQLARAEIAAGRFPTWNPYARFGAPLFANGLAAMGNPLNAVFLLGVDPRAGLAWRTYAAFAIAGLLAFFLFLRLGLSAAAACFGALVFQMGATLTANGPFYMRLDALIWAPGLLHAVLAVAEPRHGSPVRAVLGLALSSALTLLAGFPPYAVAVFLCCGLFASLLLIAAARRDGSRAALRSAVWMAAGLALGIALAAFQLAPMFAFFPESNRQMQPATSAILGQGFDPAGLLGYLLHAPFGFPGEAGLPYEQSPLAHLMWTRRDPATGSILYPLNFVFTEYAVFPGTLGLLLAGFGLLHLRDRAQRLLALCIAPLLLLSIAPSWLGFVYHLPVVASVQPMRLLAPTALCIAFLAGLGFDSVARCSLRSRLVLCAASGFAFTAFLFAVYGMRPLHDHAAVIDRIFERFAGPDRPTLDRAVAAKLIPETALQAGDLRLQSELWRTAWTFAGASLWFCALIAAHGRRVFRLLLLLGGVATAVELIALARPLDGCRDLWPDPTASPVHEFLRAEDRAHAADGGITLARAAPVAENPLVLTPGLLFPLRLRDLNSYAFVDGRSHLPFVALYGVQQMIRSYWPRTFPDDERLERPFFDLIGLRYLVSKVPLRHAGTQVGPTAIGPHATPFYVYERASALPRAFVVHDLLEVPDDEAATRALIAPDFAPRKAVLVTPTQREGLPMPTERVSDPRTVRFTTDDPDHLVLEVGDGAAGYLLCCDAAMGGWTARVDDRPVEIHRGDLFMRVVAVPAGACRVEFRYTAPGLYVGCVVTLVALLILVVSWLRTRHSSPSRRPVDDPDL
ncbi:MAG: hypothetical protein U1F36_06755 [Planctomycetota bacterium]